MSRRSLLNDLIKLHETNDSVQRGVDSWQRFLEMPDAKFYRDMLLTIKGTILSEVFSGAFTELDATEKDVMQRTYYHVNQLLDFLLAPSRYINKKKSRLINHAERQTIAKRQAQDRANAKGAVNE